MCDGCVYADDVYIYICMEEGIDACQKGGRQCHLFLYSYVMEKGTDGCRGEGKDGVFYS